MSVSPEYIDRVESIAATAAQAVAEKTQDKKFIVLYPRHRQHAALIALLYKHYGERMYYYALSDDDDTLFNFLHNHIHDAMYPIEGGENTRAAFQSTDDPSEWARGY